MITLHTDHMGRQWLDRGDGVSMASFDDTPLGGLLANAAIVALMRQGYNVAKPDGTIIAGDVLATA